MRSTDSLAIARLGSSRRQVVLVEQAPLALVCKVTSYSLWETNESQIWMIRCRFKTNLRVQHAASYLDTTSVSLDCLAWPSPTAVSQRISNATSGGSRFVAACTAPMSNHMAYLGEMVGNPMGRSHRTYKSGHRRYLKTSDLPSHEDGLVSS